MQVSTSHSTWNNVVDKKTLRKIQLKTLTELKDILIKSFGPNGSNTCIKKENALSRYTKDGHTIISALQYNGIIEQSIKDDIESITRHIVKTVGDGTTSAVIMSQSIMKSIIEIEEKYPNVHPIDIIRTMEEIVDEIKKDIEESARPFEIKDAYHIAMISTNGNKNVAEHLLTVYNKFGPGVFIDVTPNNGEEFLIKEYDGMTLASGYCDSCYVTTKSNTSEVDDPEIYFFEDPIDTREFASYLDAILARNFIEPLKNKVMEEIQPTVIFAPKISYDASAIMDSIVAEMQRMPLGNKLPICIITDIVDTDELNDLATMCGAKLIRKYIDPNVFQADIEAGRAPTPATIQNWAGAADRVISYSDKTTFIRPHAMYNEDGTYSNIYENLLEYLRNETQKAKDNGDIHLHGKMQRRLHSLESNMVELFVGGITQADRDALCDLVEDAVLNIRSAAKYGVGYAANMSGTLSAFIIAHKYFSEIGLVEEISGAIFDAYEDLYDELFGVLKIDDGEWSDTGKNLYLKDQLESAKAGLVYNITERKFDINVLSSIQSDITILDTVSKIVGIMATCNQFILPSAAHNIYNDSDS